ncbi:class I SAM-dependent DNA methyltransferase [Clostridium sp. DL1XJH146]
MFGSDILSQYYELAELYDELINEDVDYELWADTIKNECDINSIKFNDYLDIACGTGNLTQFIAPYFKFTFAVDLSSEMLMIAQQKFRDKKLKAKFICQDMSCLNLNQKFDLVTSCLDATNYLVEEEDLISYFEKVFIHLKDDGMFIFDINSYYKLTNILGNNTYTYNSNVASYIWENYLDDGVLNMELTFFTKDGELYRKFEENHTEKILSEEYIEEIIKKAGFRMLKKVDNYTDEEVQKETERITYYLKKFI